MIPPPGVSAIMVVPIHLSPSLTWAGCSPYWIEHSLAPWTLSYLLTVDAKSVFKFAVGNMLFTPTHTQLGLLHQPKQTLHHSHEFRIHFIKKRFQPVNPLFQEMSQGFLVKMFRFNSFIQVLQFHVWNKIFATFRYSIQIIQIWHST